MGAYLSEPITEKISSDDASDLLSCGASSMQGWRVSQEDAHNCILDFDTSASLFAVYDGHGGSEVALYCAKELPKFLKESDNYKKGEIEQALKDTFLGIDASVATRPVIEELKNLAGDKGNGVYGDDSSEEDMANLYQEADMPLDEVLQKYKCISPLAKLKNEVARNPALNRLKVGESSKPVSPYLRGRRNLGASQSDGASSSSADCSTKPDIEDDSDDTAVSSSSTQDPQKSEPASSSENNEDVPASSTSNGDSEMSTDVKPDMPDSSENVKEVGEKTENDIPESSTDTKVEVGSPVKEMNGEVSGSDNIEAEVSGDSSKNENVSSSSGLENGEITESVSKGKGKAKAKVTQISSSVDTSSIVKTIKNYAEKLLLATGDDSDSEDNDETFEAKEAINSSEDEELEVDAEEDDGEDSTEEEDEDEDEDDAEDQEDLQPEDNEFMAQMTEEPGSDSGCTAVVALLHNKDLYVANAGDSRCVVCRAGKAVEMSFDHKPEDEPEMKRILKAGGRVTLDGRVNGGLNLSRAIGDHAYKQNKDLGVEEQMISPVPDIKKLELNNEDEFIVLACDGIWNFMTSQDVIDFVRPRIQEGREKLSLICEEMFDHCLAPHTMGDGTGCDNMTAVIVVLKNSQSSNSIESISTSESQTKKRAASESPTNEEQVKKAKTEESSSSVDTSTQ